MKKYILFSLLLLFSFCSAYEQYEQEVADAIYYVSNKSGVDTRIYYSIIDIESNFKPYVISMIANKTIMEAAKKLPLPLYTVKTSKQKEKYLVAIFATTEDDIIKLARILYEFDFNIDMGLMQISKQHLSSIDELNFIFNPKYNLGKGSNVLADCVKTYKALAQSIECYNKGFRLKNDLNYYQKFAKSFNGHFGEKQ